MQINSSYDYYSQYASLFSSTAATSSSSFADILFDQTSSTEQDSFVSQLTALGAQDYGTAPDFSSMSIDEFREHLLEVQATLQSAGVDTSSMADPNDFSVEELEELQAQMSSKGQMPPPPPPPQSLSTSSSSLMSTFQFDDYSSLSLDALEALFGVA